MIRTDGGAMPFVSTLQSEDLHTTQRCAAGDVIQPQIPIDESAAGGVGA